MGGAAAHGPRSARAATPPRSWSPPATGAGSSRTSPSRSPAWAATWWGRASFTSQAGDALDASSIAVQDAAGPAAFEDRPRGLDRLVHAIEAAARGEVPPEAAERPAPDLGRASAFDISAGVVIDNDASPGRRLIVEATGRDRPGLVHLPTGPRPRRRRALDPVGPHRQLRRARGGQLLCLSHRRRKLANLRPLRRRSRQTPSSRYSRPQPTPPPAAARLDGLGAQAESRADAQLAALLQRQLGMPAMLHPGHSCAHDGAVSEDVRPLAGGRPRPRPFPPFRTWKQNSTPRRHPSQRPTRAPSATFPVSSLPAPYTWAIISARW